jgi:23S rRNA (guanosine2251-2'-O)-methyltransferase
MGGSRSFDRSSSAEPIVEAPPEADRFGQSPADDLIWGRHPALAALESGRPVHRIWCTPEMRFSPKFLQLLREAKSGGVLVEEVTWARLGQITGGAVHQGIVLQTAAAETLDLPTLMDGCRDLGEPPLLMAVDGLTDPHNLGAIVRSAESLGAHGLVLPQRRTAGLTGTVAKVAAGALEHLPVARVVNLNRALDTLKQEGYRVIGLAEEGTVGLHEADLDGPLVVVTGSEGTGLSLLTRRTCDQLIRIPLRGATPSLNASVATSLMLYEIARRGWMKSLSGTAPAPRIVRPQLPAPAPRVVVGDQSAESLEDADPDLGLETGFDAELPASDADLLESDLPRADLREDGVSPVASLSETVGLAEQGLPVEEIADLAGVHGAVDPELSFHPVDAGSDTHAAAPATADSAAVALADGSGEVGLERSLEAPAETPVFQANIQL